MIGTNYLTGANLSGMDHLRQSIYKILTTPIGSRVMRRDFGSLIFQLTDSPVNARGKMKFIAATAAAIAKWEPRLKLTKVNISAVMAGKIIINIFGKINSGENIDLKININLVKI